MALDFKDELIPMAYEYYLNIIEHEDSDGSDLDMGEEEEEEQDSQQK